MLAEEHFKEARSFETILSFQKDWLSQKAWHICYFLFAITILLSIGFILIILLQKKELVLIRVDNRTGEAEILSRITSAQITIDEAIDKFFASRYIILREQYNYFSLQHDYELVQIYSDKQAKDDYLLLYEQENSPDKLFGEDAHSLINIISVTISPATDNYRLATIRFKKIIKDLKSNRKKEQYYSAQVIFNYELDKDFPEEVRVKNPLGFKVVSYKVTPEIGEDNK